MSQQYDWERVFAVTESGQEGQGNLNGGTTDEQYDQNEIIDKLVVSEDTSKQSVQDRYSVICHFHGKVRARQFLTKLAAGLSNAGKNILELPPVVFGKLQFANRMVHVLSDHRIFEDDQNKERSILLMTFALAEIKPLTPEAIRIYADDQVESERKRILSTRLQALKRTDVMPYKDFLDMVDKDIEKAQFYLQSLDPGTNTAIEKMREDYRKFKAYFKA